MISNIRPCSVNAVLSGLNVTIHAKRRYTRPLVSRCNVPKAIHTSFSFCGAGGRVSCLVTSLAQILSVLHWKVCVAAPWL